MTETGDTRQSGQGVEIGTVKNQPSTEYNRRDYVKAHRLYRCLEMIPGVMIWATFAFTVILTIFAPMWAILFIILFDLLWLVRVLYLMTFIIVAFIRFRKALKVDWNKLCQESDKLERFDQLRYLVILPTHADEIDVIRTTLEHIRNSTIPLERFFIVIGFEQRDDPDARLIGDKLTEEYADVFGQWLITVHPKDVPGEMIGKGSNTAWMGRRAKDRIDALGWKYENVIVSSFDIDSCVHPQYFACVSHAFLTSPHPTRTSYQPVPLFNNNAWDAPAFTRVVANSTTFWLLSETIRTERMFTFSSHSMSFKALIDVDFWQSDIVTEDSRIFLQCLVTYDGDYHMKPIYIPISMDSVQGRTLWETMVHQYKQIRRWAYGVENFPYMVWNFRGNRLISFSRKLRYIWNQLEGEYSWATAPIMIFFLGFFPLKFASDIEKQTVLYQSAPSVLQLMMTISLIGLFTSALMSLIILPQGPKRGGPKKLFIMLLQWIIFPVITILFGSIPAIDAQTRLMLGKYLGFWPTKKIRSKT